MEEKLREIEDNARNGAGKIEEERRELEIEVKDLRK